MARLEITITGRQGQRLLFQETFEVDPTLAQQFIDKLAAMVADLPGYHRATRTRNGVTVFELDLRRPPPVVSPTFQELYRLSSRKEKTDVQETP